MLLAAVANSGTVWRPYLVDRVVSPEKKTIFKKAPETPTSRRVGRSRLDDLAPCAGREWFSRDLDGASIGRTW
jgi:membrane carboxypeptidase/penicillin-binding protein